MKNIIRFLILTLMFLVQAGYAQKLTIIDQDYEQAKLESQKQNKLLLIDFYTVWCTPCKAIEKKIFQDPAISDEMSKSFIVLRYDAERDEAHRLSLKHHIGSYPSTVVLNPDQFVLHKLYGFGGDEKDLVKNYRDFLDAAKINNSKNDYARGVSNTTKDLVYPKFYEDYVYRKNTKLDEAALKNYWDENRDLLSEVSFAVFVYFNGTDAVDSFFVENQSKYEELYGKTDVSFAKGKMTFTKFANALEAKDRKQLAAAAEFYKKLYGNTDRDYLDGWEQNMLIEENNWTGALELFLARKKRRKFDESYTDNFCSKAYRKSSDTQVLKKCVALMKEVTDRKPEFEYLNSYAYLLYKTGDLKTSEAVLKKAINIGGAAMEDTKNSEKWLKTVQDKINRQKTPGK